MPATSANLGPGFDCLGLALDLCNTVEVEYDESTDVVRIEAATGPEREDLDPENNLICRAYRKWEEESGQKLPGARFSLDLRVPMARGLGTSAAAAVAGLAAGSLYSDKKLDRPRIIRLATDIEGHPDNVAACALGGLTVAITDRNEVRTMHLANHLSLSVALFVPDRPLSTAKARTILPSKVSMEDAVFEAGRAAYLAAAVMWGRWEELRTAMQDRLHQPYRQRLIPWIFKVIEAATEAGAYGAALSGGGPSIIALTPRESSEHVAAAMERCALAHHWAGQATVTSVREQGVTLIHS